VKHHILTGLVLVLVATCPTLSWADFAARVVTVHEGDRLTIHHDAKVRRSISKISIVQNSSNLSLLFSCVEIVAVRESTI